MKTYKQFIDVLEQVTGGTLGFTRRFGSSGLPGSTAVTGSVQGGKPTGTQFSASGSLGRGTVSAQGDKINKGITQAIQNPGQAASTSTIRKGAIGSLSANVSGGGVRKKVEVPKPESKPKPEPESRQQPPSARLSKSQITRPSGGQSAPTRTSQPSPAPETAADREARWAAASRAKDELSSMAAIDRAKMARGEKPGSTVTKMYPGLGR